LPTFNYITTIHKHRLNSTTFSDFTISLVCSRGINKNKATSILLPWSLPSNM